MLGALLCALLPAGRGAAAEPGDELTISVLTFGPGDHPFLKFGHNAILVEMGPAPGEGGARPGAGEDGLVFNFGTFQFDSPALIPKFLRGRFKYWLSVAPARDTLEAYRADNRTVEIQELDLARTQKLALFAALRENARLENREYLYDYFWDNCSTRVRDAIDRALGGALRAPARAPATMTLRDDALRMTADLLPEYLGLHFGLGSLTDGPISVWQATFLPERLRDLLREVRIVGPDGVSRPLVRTERVWWKARRPDKPAAPPRWLQAFAACGVLAGAGLYGLGRAARRRRAARISLGALTAALGAVIGLLGLVLVGLWIGTNHRAAHANANILVCAPFALALAPLGVKLTRGRARATLWGWRIALACAVLCAAGLAAKIIPGPSQDNYAFILLFLPLWAGLAGGIRCLVESSAPAP
jgi:hypothetical protein